MKYYVSPLTLPVLTHNFSFEELISFFDPKNIPLTEIVIAVHTKFPFEEFSKLLIKWIIDCERISRIHVSSKFEKYFYSRNLNAEKNGEDHSVSDDINNQLWPENHRNQMIKILKQKMLIERNSM